jgi:Acetyltransferase (GNAT) family
MAWTLTADPAKFLDAAGDLLRSDPARHTVPLSVAETLRARGGAMFGGLSPLFGWWQSAGGDPECVVLHTPPYPVLVTRLPDGSAEPLAAELAARGTPVPGVDAQGRDAETFAAAWHALTGASAWVRQRTRLFRLEELVPPSPGPPGAARVAGVADRDLLVSWHEAFRAEVGGIAGSSIPGAVDDRISHGGMTLWEADGVPVAMAGVTRPSLGMIRVGPVYTPPDQRRRGYAAAATAAVSRSALAAGIEQVVLFTDLDNPTSNALYLRLGFRPVEDRTLLSFSAEAPADVSAPGNAS